MNDIEITNIYVDNKDVDIIPEKNSGYVFKEAKCSNGIIGTWNEEEWGLDLSNLKEKTTCKIYFLSLENVNGGKNPNTGISINIIIIITLIIIMIVILKKVKNKRKFARI